MSRTFVTFESREAAFHGVQLLILSMQRHARARLQLSIYSNAFPDWFRDWLKQTDTGIVAVGTHSYDGELADWNVKPHIIRNELRKGVPSVAWLDSDILVARPFEALFESVALDEMLIADQPGLPDSRRTTALDLIPASHLPRSINSSVFITSQRHLPLIDAWIRLLETPAYKAAQLLPFAKRPPYLYGDQDVLEGLLSSTWAATHGFHVDRFLDCRSEILHAGNQSLGTLLRWLTRRKPIFLHAQGIKPWWLDRERRRVQDVCLELSPYVAEARNYYAQVDAAGRYEWTTHATSVGRVCRHLGANGRLLPLIIFSIIRRFIPRNYFDPR